MPPLEAQPHRTLGGIAARKFINLNGELETHRTSGGTAAGEFANHLSRHSILSALTFKGSLSNGFLSQIRALENL